MIKIAFFITSLSSGGIENYLLRFLTYYKDKLEAVIYCKSGTTGELEDAFNQLPVTIIKYKLSLYNPLNILKIKRNLKKYNFDAVIDFTANFAAYPMIAAKWANIEHRVCWYRNADVKFKKTFFKLFFNKCMNLLTNNFASNILSNSIAAFDNFYKHYPWRTDKRFKVIYNGIDVEKFLNNKETIRDELNLSNNDFLVGHVGRYDSQKNHETAIKVASELCKSFNDIYFIFVGNGIKEALKLKIKSQDLEHRIFLFDYRDDIPLILNSIDCFYFPSTLEGNPNALIEAMVAGVPIIASNIPSIKEATPKQIHPYLIDPMDIKEAKQLILKIKTQDNFKEQLICTNWAINQYNAAVQFKAFFDIINK